jgi:hypothetical protein
MSDFFERLWAWILSLFGGEPKAIRITGKTLCMPLFYPRHGGGVDGTWNYLSKSPAAQKYCREQVKAVAVRGEQPAITFLLAPSNEAGNIWAPFPNLDPAAVARAKAAIRELVEDGIAVLVTLYNDDPSGSMPRWWEIDRYVSVWAQLWLEIRRYVSGCILSIESNEHTSNVKQLQHCIYCMAQAMPGAEAYGTHLQWKGGGQGGYRWNSAAATPNNATILLVENSWQPQAGDRVGVSGVRREWDEVRAAVPLAKVIWHEFNYNPRGPVDQAQRAFFRSRDQWGVG